VRVGDVLGQVLPGLREVRAPLAAGYLWLLFAWLVAGHRVPNRADDVDGPVARVYDLEPIVTGFGVAVVASVVAYIVGSIAIDAQEWLNRRWRPERLKLPITDAGKDRLESLLPPQGAENLEGMDADDRERLEIVGRSHLATKKNLLKIRLLNESGELYSEVDRPDAEARFRSSLWVPLSVTILYLCTDSAWWLPALVAPLALFGQSRRLKCEANDLLLTALVARNELRDDVRDNIQRAWDEDTTADPARPPAEISDRPWPAPPELPSPPHADERP
jgi:hypothetical protein